MRRVRRFSVPGRALPLAAVLVAVLTIPAHADVEERLREIEGIRDGAVYLESLVALYGETKDARALLGIARYRYAVGAYTQAAEDFANAVRGLDGDDREEAEVGEAVSLCAAGNREEGLAILEREARGRSRHADRPVVAVAGT